MTTKDATPDRIKQLSEALKPEKNCRECCTKCPVKLAHEETWKNGITKQ